MDKSALDIYKNANDASENDWRKYMPVAEYGEIIKVIDSNTVVVKRTTQDSVAVKVYTVRLFNIGSILYEETIEPQLGDQVLLLFLRAYNEKMFLDPVERGKKNDGDTTVYDRDCRNYDMFTGISFLVRTFKGRSYITKSIRLDDDGAHIEEQVMAYVIEHFMGSVLASFDKAMTAIFSKGAPVDLEHHDAINIDIGFDSNDDTVEFDAPVGVKLGSQSGIDIKSKSSANLELDKDLSLKAEKIRLNVDNPADYPVMFNKLNSKLQDLITKYNQDMASIKAGAAAAVTASGYWLTPLPAIGAATLDISGAKKDTIEI